MDGRARKNEHGRTDGRARRNKHSDARTGKTSCLPQPEGAAREAGPLPTSAEGTRRRQARDSQARCSPRARGGQRTNGRNQLSAATRGCSERGRATAHVHGGHSPTASEGQSSSLFATSKGRARLLVRGKVWRPRLAAVGYVRSPHGQSSSFR